MSTGPPTGAAPFLGLPTGAAYDTGKEARNAWWSKVLVRYAWYATHPKVTRDRSAVWRPIWR